MCPIPLLCDISLSSCLSLAPEPAVALYFYTNYLCSASHFQNCFQYQANSRQFHSLMLPKLNVKGTHLSWTDTVIPALGYDKFSYSYVEIGFVGRRLAASPPMQYDVSLSRTTHLGQILKVPSIYKGACNCAT